MAFRHVQRGSALGLLRRFAPLYGGPRLIVATRAGQRWCGAGLEVPPLNPALVFHWAACSRLALELEAEFAGARILSEAELRLDEAIAGRAIASAAVGEREDGAPRLHRPDLVVVNGGKPLAVEVELSAKAPVRLAGIVKAWRKASCVQGVRYYVAPGKTRRAVERAIEVTYSGERVQLVELEMREGR